MENKILHLELNSAASTYVFMDQMESLDGARTACQERFNGELLKTPTEGVYQRSTEFLNNYFGVSCHLCKIRLKRNK